MSRSSPLCKSWERNRCEINERHICRPLWTHFVLKVIYGLNSSSLRPVEQFTPDVVVCLDSWVGIIKEVVVDLVLKFKDGSLCRLKDVDAELLQDVNDNRDEVSLHEISYHNTFKQSGVSGLRIQAL